MTTLRQLENVPLNYLATANAQKKYILSIRNNDVNFDEDTTLLIGTGKEALDYLKERYNYGEFLAERDLQENGNNLLLFIDFLETDEERDFIFIHLLKTKNKNEKNNRSHRKKYQLQ